MSTFPRVCPSCGAAHSRADWQRLTYLGVHLDCLEARLCTCGDTLTIEVDGYGGANDHFGAMRNLEDG